MRTTALERTNLSIGDLADAPVVCPAGSKIHGCPEGPACHCRIANELIGAAKNPASLALFCMGRYETCPTWKADKDAEAERRHKAFARELAEA